MQNKESEPIKTPEMLEEERLERIYGSLKYYKYPTRDEELEEKKRKYLIKLKEKAKSMPSYINMEARKKKSSKKSKRKRCSCKKK